MIRIITTQHRLYPQMLSLRQEVLRAPLGLNLYDEDLKAERDQVIFVAEMDGCVVACVLLQQLVADVFKLRQMAVHAKHQGKGLGQQLLQAVEGFTQRSGGRRIILHARAVALGFYQRSGYEIDGPEFMEVGLPHFLMVKYL